MAKLSRKSKNAGEINSLAGRLIEAVALLRNKEEISSFFNDLLTSSEKGMLGKRILIAMFLENGYSYGEIERVLKVSQATIGTVSNILQQSGNGLRLILK